MYTVRFYNCSKTSELPLSIYHMNLPILAFGLRLLKEATILVTIKAKKREVLARLGRTNPKHNENPYLTTSFFTRLL